MPLIKATLLSRIACMMLFGWLVITIKASVNSECYAQPSATSAYTVYPEHYMNPIFGYGLSLPKGFIGVGPSGDVPHHGISINLSADGTNYIWVAGNYNVLEYKDSREAAEEIAVDLKEQGATYVRITQSSSTRLCNCDAIRQTVMFKDKLGGSKVEEAVTALRFYDEGPGIIYTLGMRTGPKQFDEHSRVFEHVLNSFKCSDPTG